MDGFQTLSIQPRNYETISADYERRLEFAIDKTTLMFGAFRKGEANDPKIYTASVAKTLARFEEDVIEYVTNVETGLPATNDFLPTIKEVREACEDRANFLQRQNDREIQARKQLEERVVLPDVSTYKCPPGSRLVSWRDQTPQERNKRPIGIFEKPGDTWNRNIPSEGQ